MGGYETTCVPGSKRVGVIQGSIDAVSAFSLDRSNGCQMGRGSVRMPVFRPLTGIRFNQRKSGSWQQDGQGWAFCTLEPTFAAAGGMVAFDQSCVSNLFGPD